MTTADPHTLRLEVPKRRVAADLIDISRHLAEAALQGVLLQDWPSVVSNLSSALQTLKIKHSEGALAWELLLLGIGESLAELANAQPPTLINDADVKTIVRRITQEAEDLIIPTDFLDHPWDLPPVRLAKKTLLKWIAPPSMAGRQQDLVNLARRFDSALVLGLRRAIRRDELRYRPLLALREDPTAAAWQELDDWRLYRARLISDFRTAPVFDEVFALDQIYVPPNAWHWEKIASLEKSEQRGVHRDVRKVVRLNDDMLKWLLDERGATKLRLISGGPGSGKSSAMKALAAQLAENGFDNHSIDVLLFPLQRFHWRTGIVESVEATLVDYSDQMRHNPLEADFLRRRQKPLLLIFDGLDELTTSLEVGEAISATFLRELSTALRTWKDHPVRAIVTGREAIFGNVAGPATTLSGPLFQLLPYHIRRYEPGAPSLSDYHDPDHLLATDNRHLAFSRFAKAKGESPDKLPDLYSNNELHDVSAQPLLNYFLLTAGPDDLVDGNIARIYGQLFNRLHARNRNVEGRPEGAGKPGAGLSQEEFDRVFEVMAVAVWRAGGTRSAAWRDILSEAGREDSYLRSGKQSLHDIFNSNMQERGVQRPFRLAAAFFMRNNEATGVEFTHKSFGDYLYARRLAKAVTAMMEALLVLPEAEREMLGRWEALTAERRMSNEVRRFLELELSLMLDNEQRDRWFVCLASIVERIFRDGYSVSGQKTARHAEQLSSQMEEALFIVWHALWRPQTASAHWTLGNNTGDLLRRVLARQESAHGMQTPSTFLRAWSGVDLSGEVLAHVNLERVNLERANLEGAKLQYANLSLADLRKATLVKANMASVNLSFANLAKANLNGAYLYGATLDEANLDQANLEGCSLMRASLEMTSFERANLKGADLRHATLGDTFFNGANLMGATLTGADLDNTILEDANLSHADLSGASVRNAVLNRADLRGAHLTGIDLSGAQLEGAILDPAVQANIGTNQEQS